jgi:predicted nucleic acid-binding protein
MSGVESLFLDTNVLVYVHDKTEPVKGARARQLLSEVGKAGRPLFSVQVLSEFYWTATRKLPVPMTHDEAVAEAKRLMVIGSVVPLTTDLLTKAFEAAAAHQMPLWDAQIFAAAKLNRATTVLSEDFQHRRTVEGVTFLNPFAADFDLKEILSP